MKRRALATAAVLAVSALLVVPSAMPAAAAESSLPAIKAAFVFNFIKLVYWPERRFVSESAPVKVCVLRGDEMLESLRSSIAGKLAGARPLEIAVVGTDEDFGNCHVLYLGSQVSSRYGALMARASGKGVLLVDEGEQFSWPDGMIRLFLEQSRVRFELNLEAMERAGLKVDPRLIRLARIASR